MHLYKYLPEQYVESLLAGNILFRNIVYFKQLNTDPRRDVFEGMHVDAPEHPVEITVISTGKKIKGQFEYHNAIKNMERIFCFCTSMEKNDALQKFGSACIEILDSEQFELRVQRVLIRRNRLTPLDMPLLKAGPVSYYDVTKEAPVDIKDARQLPFLKRASFSDEKEYRLVFAKRGGHELLQRLVTKAYSEAEDVAKLRALDILLNIGPIKDIARQI